MSMKQLVATLVVIAGLGVSGPSPRNTPGESGSEKARQEEQLKQIRDLLRNGKYPDAAGRARGLLPHFEADHGPESMQTAELLDLLSEAVRRAGGANDPEPQALATRALAIKEELLGPDDPAVAVSLFNLASALYRSGEIEQARPVFERALAMRRDRLGAEHPLVAETMDYLGNLLMDLGDEPGAEPLLRSALEIRERAFGPDSLDVAWSLNSLAKLCWNRGDYDGALPFWRRALGIREKGLRPDHPLVGASLNNLATVLQAKGDYAGAAPIWQRALALRQATLPPGHPLIAAAMERLATVYLDTGDYEAARPLIEKALAIRRKTLGPDHPSVVETMESLADLLAATGNDEAAFRLLEQGLEMREKTLKPGDPMVARSLAGLAGAYVRQRNCAEARPMYERALAIQEAAFGPDHPHVASTLGSLGSLLETTGSSAEAEPLFQRELKILNAALGSRHPDVARALNDLAMARAHLGRRDEALEDALHAEEISREHFRLTGRALTERQALLYASIATTGLDLALSLASGDPNTVPGAGTKALDALIRSRSLVLDETAARHRVLESTGDPETVRLASGLRATTTQVANLVVRGVGDDTPDRYRSRLDHALEEKAGVERALAARSEVFRRTQALEHVGLKEVAASLPTDSALVSYVVYAGESVRDDRYLAFVLRGGQKEPTVVPIGPAAEIDALVMRWRQELAGGLMTQDRSMADAEARCRREGEALRRRIWDPLDAGLRGTSRVFIVPDGALQLVSFAALPAPARNDTAYLVETGPLVHYLSTERDLTTPPRPKAQSEVMLALGQPDFDRAARRGMKPSSATFRGEPSGCGGFQSMRFGSLPATGQEVQEVTDLWNRQPGASAVKLLGAQASEAAFKEQAPGKRILHLATHGFFLGHGCARGAASSRGIGGLAPLENHLPAAAGENPLLLSGLALAGANDRRASSPDQEDGILTAEEIAAMGLSGVEWAVLSACDTGAGEVIAGEGVFGLRRALQVAGAGTVIMSLWSVEDEAARQWMAVLYEGRLVKGLGTAEAVRGATLETLRARRARGVSTHPFYWAGFIAAGDWK